LCVRAGRRSLLLSFPPCGRRPKRPVFSGCEETMPKESKTMTATAASCYELREVLGVTDCPPRCPWALTYPAPARPCWQSVQPVTPADLRKLERPRKSTKRSRRWAATKGKG
jgi:hypothetical protein